MATPQLEAESPRVMESKDNKSVIGIVEAQKTCNSQPTA
jgi:hypothetical protein